MHGSPSTGLWSGPGTGGDEAAVVAHFVEDTFNAISNNVNDTAYGYFMTKVEEVSHTAQTIESVAWQCKKAQDNGLKFILQVRDDEAVMRTADKATDIVDYWLDGLADSNNNGTGVALVPDVLMYTNEPEFNNQSKTAEEIGERIAEIYANYDTGHSFKFGVGDLASYANGLKYIGTVLQEIEDWDSANSTSLMSRVATISSHTYNQRPNLVSEPIHYSGSTYRSWPAAIAKLLEDFQAPNGNLPSSVDILMSEGDLTFSALSNKDDLWNAKAYAFSAIFNLAHAREKCYCLDFTIQGGITSANPVPDSNGFYKDGDPTVNANRHPSGTAMEEVVAPFLDRVLLSISREANGSEQAWDSCEIFATSVSDGGGDGVLQVVVGFSPPEVYDVSSPVLNDVKENMKKWWNIFKGANNPSEGGTVPMTWDNVWDYLHASGTKPDDPDWEPSTTNWARLQDAHDKMVDDSEITAALEITIELQFPSGYTAGSTTVIESSAFGSGTITENASVGRIASWKMPPHSLWYGTVAYTH